MTYVDYEYYTDEYMQGLTPTIDATSFLFLEKKAENYLDFNTQSEYLTFVEEEDVAKVKDCICALVDSYKQEQISSTNGAFIRSESVGGHSVSYEGKTTHQFENERYSIMRSYLWKLGIVRNRKVYGLNET